MLNIISLVLGIGAWAVTAIGVAKPACSQKSTILSFALCAFSLVVELFEISRRVNLGDYAAIEDTIRAVIIANTVKADAGMLVTMMLFFVVHPIVSIVTGILAGKDIKFFWFTPILVACLFWAFSSFTYVTAFPIVYSAAYLVICAISMLITWFVIRKEK